MTQDALRSVLITNPEGLHLRPAHAFVSLASGFTSKISVAKDAEWVDGKSILSLVTLGAAAGSTLQVRAEGDDAEAAVEALADLLTNLENLSHKEAEK